MSAKISRAGLEVAAQRRHRKRGVQRLGTFRVADSQIVKCGQQLAAIARAGPSRDPLRRHRRRPAAQFSPAAPSYAAPAGKSSVNAADWTPGIASATSTRPLGNVCCSIVDDAAGKGTSSIFRS